MWSSEENHEVMFTSLYRQYFREVYQFLIFFTGNKNEAEDLTQEVFLRVATKIHMFEGRSQMKTWILAIAKNVARNWRRKKFFSTLFNLETASTLSAHDGIPSSELEKKEEILEVFQALTKLKAQYRMVFILRVIKEYTVKETAEILDCSEAKVKVDYHRAIKKLQKEINFFDEEE